MPSTKSPRLLSDQISDVELSVVIRHCLEAMQRCVAGDIVEFGCYVGTTSVHLQPIALRCNRKLHLYDSFEGLPEKSTYDTSPLGQNFKAGELMASKKILIQNFVKAQLPLPIVHKGWFDQLSNNDLPSNIAFAFLDGDFYESILISLKLVWPLLDNSGYILVHDYDRPSLPGATKAVQDYTAYNQSCKLARVEHNIAILQK